MINRVAPVQARQRRLTFDSMGRSAGVIVLVAATVYTLAPIWWLVVASTKDNADLLGTNGFLFADFSLVSNLVALNTEQGGIFWRWIANTVFYAGIGAVLSTLIAFLAGHAFEKFNFRGKETLFGVVLLGVLLPSAVTAMPLYLLASQLGLVNTYWGVFLPLLVNPFGVYLARIMSRSYVPEEVLEAARIDGAGEIRSFFTVALPMMIPAFVTVLLITFNSIWNNFFLPLLMLSNPELYPVSLGIYYWNSLTGADSTMYHLVIIASAVAVIPVIAIFLMLQRYWRSGLGDGAIK